MNDKLGMPFYFGIKPYNSFYNFTVEQIFTKVNEAFLQRHQLSKVLVNDIHENEIQLQFLEHQIRDQFDLNVKQSAALSMTTHSMIEVGATVLDFGTGDAATLKKSFDSLQDQANQSNDQFY